MEKITWVVHAKWDDGSAITRTTDKLEVVHQILRAEVFCPKHGCPMPLTVSIVRAP